MRKPTSDKINLVIHDKKLPHNAENAHKNWLSSTEGKARRQQAKEHQNNIQSACNEALAKKKKETGTTGMSDRGYRDVIGQIMEDHSARNAFGAITGRKNKFAKTYAFRNINGKKKLVQIDGPGM